MYINPLLWILELVNTYFCVFRDNIARNENKTRKVLRVRTKHAFLCIWFHSLLVKVSEENTCLRCLTFTIPVISRLRAILGENWQKFRYNRATYFSLCFVIHFSFSLIEYQYWFVWVWRKAVHKKYNRCGTTGPCGLFWINRLRRLMVKIWGHTSFVTVGKLQKKDASYLTQLVKWYRRIKRYSKFVIYWNHFNQRFMCVSSYLKEALSIIDLFYFL